MSRPVIMTVAISYFASLVFHNINLLLTIVGQWGEDVRDFGYDRHSRSFMHVCFVYNHHV